MPISIAAFPQQVAQFTDKFDLTDVVFAAHINALQAEVTSIETALGTLPAGTSSTVKARIGAVENGLSAINTRLGAGTGPIAQAAVSGLPDALAALSTSVSALNTALTTESTSRSSGDASNATALTAAINNLNDAIDALPKGYITGMSIGSSDTITSSASALSSANTPYKLIAHLPAGRVYLVLFTLTSTIDMVAAGGAGGSDCNLRLMMRTNSQAFPNFTTDSVIGECRSVLGNGNSQTEGSGPSLSALITPSLTANYTFGFYAYCTKNGYTAQLLTTGANYDHVDAVPTHSLLSIHDVGKQ